MSSRKSRFPNRSQLRRRVSQIEKLEERRLLVSDWQNGNFPNDVNNDLFVSPTDALLVINRLNSTEQRSLHSSHVSLQPYIDTNGDRLVSPSDALRVINSLNSNKSSDRVIPRIEGEAASAPAGFLSIPFTRLPGQSGQVVPLSTTLNIGREEFNEMGIFVADDASGRVDGILPGEPGYAEAVFNSSQRRVLYSRFNTLRTASDSNLPAGSYAHVYVLQSSSDASDPNDHLRSRQVSTNLMQVGWEEDISPFSVWTQVGDRSYDDATVDFQIGQPFDGNAEPVLRAIPNQSMNELASLVVSALAMDSDLPNDSISYSLDIAPTGATIDVATGEITWTPTEAQGPGNFEFLVRATDSAGTFDTESFFVTVLETNQPPEFTPIGNVVAKPGQLLTFKLSANDSDLPAQTLTYSLLAGAPVGATIDPLSGEFRWAVPASQSLGTYPINVRASDSGTPVSSFSTSFNITVGCSTLSDWTTFESGGTNSGKGTVTTNGCSATIREGDSFLVGMEKEIVVSSSKSAISFSVTDRAFDTSTSGLIKDAFEVAIVDQTGAPIVPTFAPNRDAAFNITEGLPAIGNSVQQDGNVVTISLADVPIGTKAKVIFRIASNDLDRATSVSISNFNIVTGIGRSSANVNTPVQPELKSLGNLATQSLQVSSAPSPDKPNINFNRLDATTRQSSRIELGRMYADSMASIGEQKQYVFDASAGSRIYLDAQVESEFLVFRWNLLDVTSGKSTSWIDFSDQLVTIENTGTHVITVERTWPGSGYYQFQLWEAPSNFHDIRIGDQVSGSIDVPGTSHTYRFSGKAGQNLALEIFEGKGIGLSRVYTLVSPTGEQVFTESSNPGNFTLPEDGQYELSVFDKIFTSFKLAIDHIGNFGFRLKQQDDPSTFSTQFDVVAKNVEWNWADRSKREIEVSWDVYNASTVASNVDHLANRVMLYDSLEEQKLGVVRGYFEVISDDFLVDSLLPNTSQRVSTRVTIPADLHGEVQIGILVDVFNSIAETNESNNFASTELIPLPPVLSEAGGTIQVAGVPPVQTANQPILITGDASSSRTSSNNIFVIDVSGSTGLIIDDNGNVVGPLEGLDTNDDGLIDSLDNPNGDERVGDVLDVEINATLAALKRLPVDGSQAVSVIAFGSTSFFYDYPITTSLDLSEQPYRQTSIVLDANSLPNIELAIRTLRFQNPFHSYSEATLFHKLTIGSGNDLGLVMSEVERLLNALPDSSRKNLFLLGDDGPALGGDVTIEQLESIAGVGIQFHAFQINGKDLAEPYVRMLNVFNSSPNSSGSATILSSPEDLYSALAIENDIEAMYVNGVAVDALDSNGDFFASYVVQPGLNHVEISAVDSFGSTSRTTIQITGTDSQAAIDLSQLTDISSAFAGTYGRTSFNSESDTLFVDLATSNLSAFDIDVPLLVGIRNLRPVDGSQGYVSIVGGNGILSDGTPYVDFSSYVEGRRLGPGDTTAAPSIQFHNPQRVPFTYDLVFFSKLNSAPEITSVPLLETMSGKSYTYGVTARDSDGDTLTYRLLQSPTGMTINTQTGVIAWTPVSSQIGSQAISLAVSDSRGGESRQEYILSTFVAPPNRPPVISSVPKTSFVLGSSTNYSYALKAADADNDPMTYRFGIGEFPSGMEIDSATGLVSWTPSNSQVGTHHVQVQVNDGRGGVAIQEFEICIHPSLPADTAPDSNSAPIFTSVLPATVVQDRKISVDLTVVDADHDSVAVSLASTSPGQLVSTQTTLPDGTIGANRYRYEWTPTAADVAAGVRTIRLEARDGQGGLGVLESIVTVVADAANKAPEITSLPTKFVYPGFPYRYLVRSKDPDGHELSTLLATNPAGMTVNADGLIEWNPPSGFNTSANVEVIVADSFGGSARQTFTIEARNEFTNSAPAIISTPRVTVRESKTYVYDARAVDVEGDLVTWALEVAPRGMVVDAESGAIRWNPEERQVGKHEVVLKATDIYGASSTQSFEIDVTCVNAPPVIRSAPITSAFVDDRYLYSVRADDVDRDPLQFRLLSTVAGMTISPLGLIRWTPSAADLNQTRNVVIEVTDGQGGVAVQRYDLVVGQESNANKAPSIESTPIFVARTGNAYQYNVMAIDVDGDQVTYRLSQKPGWMSIDKNSGLITGTPTTSGSVSVSLEAVDSHGAIATQAYTIAVRDNQAPIINSSPATSTSPNAVYRYYVRANDPDGDSLRYSLVEAPAGMRIDGNGLLRWSTPDSSSESVPVTVQVSDPYGGVAEQTFVLSLVADTTPPQVSIVASTNIIDIGGVIQLQVQASDNIGVVERTLTVGEQSILLDASGRGFFTGSKQELVEAIATAKDAAGNSSQSRVQLRVIDPTDDQGPQVVITSPSINADVTYLTDIVGSVTVPSGQQLEFYRVEFAPAEQVDLNSIGSDTPEWRVISQGNTPVVNGKLATFDPTMLRNGGYVIRVAAFNTNGKGWAEPLPVSVHGAAKFGQFRIEFTDLTIPLAGIPIQITRQYNSLDANVSNDFGFGWKLSANDPQILETGLDSKTVFLSDERNFLPGKTKVYLTNPEGKRVGFTYTEEPETVGFVSANFRPKYIPDPGVYDQLDSPGIIGRGLFGFVGYNPSEYTLTTKEGTKYRYTQASGLDDITDLNGNKITFTDSGISHSDGTQIQFIRDGQGRIREIVDPDGNRVRYVYDATGNLVEFIDQTSQTTRYTYHTNPAHYLNEAFDARGIKTLQVVYAADGRYMHVIDALGNITNAQQTDLLNRQAIVRDGNGNETKLNFDDRGNVLEEIDPLGNKTVREYKDSRNPDLETRIIDKNGHVTDREYDARGNLLKNSELGTLSAPFSVPLTTMYTYDNGNRVTSITDARQKTTSFNFDASGNPISLTNVMNDSMSFVYDTSGKITKLTDLRGNTTEFFDYVGENPKKVAFADGTQKRLDYNLFGQITYEAFVEADGKVAWQRSRSFDDSGRLTQETLGSTTDGSARIRRLFYDGDLLDWEVIINPESLDNTGALKESPSTPISQRKSAITDYEYDANKKLIKQIDPMGGVTQFRHDAAGNQIARQDPNGNITTWIFNKNGQPEEERDALYWDSIRSRDAALTALSDDEYLNLIAPVDIDSIANPLFDDPSGASCSSKTSVSHVKLTCYDPVGNIAVEIDEAGRRTEFDYDFMKNVTQQRSFDNMGMLMRTLRWTYDAVGNKLTETDGKGNKTSYSYDAASRLVTETDPLGGKTTREYDAAGNEIAFTDQNGNKSTSVFDLRNRLIRETDPAGFGRNFAYDSAGNQIKVTDHQSNTTNLRYNQAGQLVVTTDVLGATVTNDFDSLGNLTAITDQLGRTTSYVFDLNGRTLTEIDAEGGVLRYGYDLVGNRVQIVDQVGNRTLFGFDSLNRQISETDPLGHTISTSYDAVGNRIEIVDRNGRRRAFSYDSMDRVTSEMWYTGATLNRTINSSFDMNGNLLSIADPDSKYTFTYDADNRRLTDDNLGTPGAPRITVTSTYDPVGNRIRVGDNLGVTISSSYNSRGLLSTKNWQGGGISDARLDFSYDSRGDRTTVDRYRDLTATSKISSSSQSYDKLSRLTSIIHVGGGTTASSYSYSYNAASRLISETRNDRQIDYGYDRTDQLTSATSGGSQSESFSYDESGNRTNSGYQTTTGNRLRTDGVFNYVHDNEGNLTSKVEIASGERNEFSYDHRNRLTRVVKQSSGGIVLQDVRYVYDALNRRIQINANGIRTFVVHDGDATWADFDSVGTVKARYLIGDDIDKMLARWRPSEGTSWYLTDKLGSVRELLNSSGAVVNRIDYNSFGRILSQSNQSVSDRFSYTGREFDFDTGIYYYRARFYDPVVGRFLSEDPIRFEAGDSNLWRFVGNSPLIARDPTGLAAATEYGVFTLPAFGVASAILQYTTFSETRRANGLFVRAIGFGNNRFGVLSEGKLSQIAVVLKVTKDVAVVVGNYVTATATVNGDPNDPCGDDPLRGNLASEIANQLGYTQRIPPQRAPFNTHGQPLYRSPRTGNYISPDRDRHRGGAWKQFDRSGNRLGTFDCFLDNRLGD